MKDVPPSKFTIVRDTREQIGWTFEEDEHCAGTTILKLETGDYSVFGLEKDKLCIERKQSVNEIATNITQDRFARELVRMNKFAHKYLILEFDVDDVLKYPVGSNVPREKWAKIRTTGKFILSSLVDMSVRYNIHVIFAGDADNAAKIGYSIMKKVSKQYD